ncbi:MAG TPA: serine/threonine-protein kinase, partial [Polyangiaceae bacterium]|nr:serine/threonine-protein kinase [Polyangiaceae bacterium]
LAPLFNVGIMYYFGIFGPALVVFVLNRYTACLNYDRRVARVALLGSLALVMGLGVPMALGWLADPGLISVTTDGGNAARWVVLVLFSAFMVVIYGQARRTRELLVASLEERDEAVVRASQRQALFLEARQDLERALQAGGLGRFTDQTLGSYKLGGVLGRGGMGEVYEATHVDTGERAAVKMLLPEVLARPDYVRRFMREVRITASVRSPHVARVLEIGDETAPLPYLAMERLDGEDLAQILRREERLSHEAVVELVRQVARGLHAAGEAGVVHRDLKPHNVFRTGAAEPLWKILDFGVSQLVESSSTLTQGEAIGTPQYMAPEQARGGGVDARADLYGLGAIAYRALTGRPPFEALDLAEVLLAVIGQMPVRPSALVRVPRDVDLALAIAMAKRPEDRFNDAAELANAMEAAMEGRLVARDRKRAAALLRSLPWSEPTPFTES